MGSSASFDAIGTVFNSVFQIMNIDFYIFDIRLSFWDLFLWSIVMYALLKLFFSLFE